MGSHAVSENLNSETKSVSKANNISTTNTRFQASSIASIENLSYYPTTDENSDFLNDLMIQVHHKLTDASHDTIVSATDVILEILKNDEMSVTDKRQEIDSLLDTKVTDVELNDLINLGKKITDYRQHEQADDNQEGMAIVFEEDEDEEENVAEAEAAVEEEDDEFRSPVPVAESTAGEDDYIDKKLVDVEKDVVDDFKVKLADLELSGSDLEGELSNIVKDTQILHHLLDNRWKIVFKMKFIRSGYESIKQQLVDLNLLELIEEFNELMAANNKKRRLSEDNVDKSTKSTKIEKRIPKRIDLEALVFDQGAHLMASTKVKLPKGSYQQNKKLYDIVSIPAPEIPDEVIEARKNLVPITDMPEWAQEAFPSGETATLNVVQSKIYPMAFKTDENLLLCAPTGAGKTNVAMLTILRTIENFRTESGQIKLNDFKMVYIAPLKALVQEQMREFQRRLTANYGVVVNQLSGDSNLTKQQIVETQLLVVTPEKWDVITRKSTDLSYTNLVRLIVIDEIHLLHDERGPVLESIVSRTLRQVEETGNNVRLVGLSATLPNFEDVARFLRVDMEKGLFFFNATYRPCPLEQKFIGIKEKKAIKKLAAMNEACYEMLTDSILSNQQLIIFVHSRKETFKTANWLKNKLEEEEKLDSFLGSSLGVKEILKSEADMMLNKNLQEILPSGFGIHHAGLNKDERTVVEDLFAQGHIKCLISTATLAWGVNLPAHTVVIKGTETYSPEKGTWVQLSPQDIIQMLGRAGRPRYDKSGEGVIITSQDEIQYYLAILNQQLPIESQLMGKLADNINAEIVLGTISSLEDAVNWLSYTYLYIRMLKSPALYHVGAEYGNDENLYYKRLDLAHSALMVLQENNLVNYNPVSGNVKATELGKIASHYYINYRTMNMYNNHLKPWLTEIELLSIFASSGEFKFIPLRSEEKLEVSKLYEKVPIPIKENSTDPLAKVNVLLQAYISRLTLEGFALMADMIYVTQSAGRLLRALHEICLRKNWASVSKTTLDLCKMVEKRMWLTNSALRQFGSSVSKEIVRATESSHVPFVNYFTLSPEALAEAVNLKGNSRRVHELLKQFPRLNLSYYAQPLTHNLLRVQVEVVPNWDWNPSVHGNFQDFLLFVEDCDGDKILYRDKVSFARSSENKELLVEFTLPFLDPVQPNYFVSFINDRWLHSEYKIPLMISDLKIPKKSPNFTKLQDQPNVLTSEVKVPDFIETFDFKYFNKFQSQVFQSLYNTDDNTFIGMSKGSGKTVCAELAILRHWKNNKGRILYLQPNEQAVYKLTKRWKKLYRSIGGEGKEVEKLTGELATDLAILSSNHLILSTPEVFDFVSKRWRQRKAVQAIEMVICDDVQLIGSGSSGVSYENVVARMKFISSQLEVNIRFVALSSTLANGRDFGEYLECPRQSIYNFEPSERFHKIQEIVIQGTNFGDNRTMLLNSIKPSYTFLKNNTGQGKSLLFVSSRKNCVEAAYNIVQNAENDSWKLLRSDVASIESYLNKVKDHTLKELLKRGVGIFYPDMNSVDQLVVERLFESEVLTVLVVAKDCASFCPPANHVVVLGTEEYYGREHRYVNFPINTVLEMIGCCSDEMGQSKVMIFTRNATMNHYSKFLNEGLPLESYYNSMIHDIFITEVSNRTFKERQDCVDWLTFTYFYRRLQMNPSFYDVKDTSHMGISEFLSDLVEETIKDLTDNNLIELEEAEEILSPLNGALIASHHNVSYHTMVELNKLDNKTKLRGILEIVCSAAEFEELPMRLGDSTNLQKIYNQVPVKSSNPDFESPYFKTFILLQAHFSRLQLPLDLRADLVFILKQVMKVIGACVDTVSSEGYLNAIQVVDLSQMVIQGIWNRDSPLKQIPHINEGILTRCKKYNVETVYDIMALEDDERDDVLQLEEAELEDVAEFVNKYPNVDISYELEESVVANEPVMVTVNLERDEEMEDLSVVSSVFESHKREEWWIVIGDAASKQLYGIKKTSIAKESQTVQLEMTIPSSGKHNLTIWCMCDSYLDADKEVSLEVEVQPGE
ncbi:Sec63-domain-containing protein [Yamadazyma tenuis ATCC 10573]|uniref:Sec63-domain-containing protein n=1 Tax=Candida tenuis (strain ATCC 10573 / BCRC 21748 / CBS 615 / JCM 9827 / NBRC 10315 / NRRL Y-1498 / VKM Y-70) TaxID=590646 RepID=G3B9C0_CANTC|nr:Sec63-domain-containing protein [Yamadazyma tenuis ATCC 10573]EGV61861.1 Sec63-domain-containing protein [Yamadazyma tenuis ATCC 10573]